MMRSLAVLSLVLVSCGGGKGDLAKVDRALLRLQAVKDVSGESDAMESLRGIKITPDVGERLIRAAAEAYPNVAGRESETNSKLLHLVWENPLPEFRGTVSEVYDRLEGKREARESALRLLVEMQDRGARAQVIELLKRPSSKTVTSSWVFVPWKPSADLARDLFPGLLEAASGLSNASGVYSLVLDFAEKNFLKPDDHAGFVTHCVDRCRQLLETRKDAFAKYGLFLDELETPPDGSPVPDDVHEDFFQLEILLDLLAYSASTSVPPLLRAALEQPSYRLKIFGACSLLMRKEAVEPSVLENLASAPAGRGLLWLCMKKRMLQSQFPAKYRTPKALAEGGMVHWLQFPTEMGKAPREIRHLATIRTVEEGRRELLFFFVFRHPTFAEGKWQVGVSGPFPEDSPDASGGGATFSKFKTLDSQTLEAHIKDYTDSGYKILERSEPPK
jgi:hypothetical protein